MVDKVINWAENLNMYRLSMSLHNIKNRYIDFWLIGSCLSFTVLMPKDMMITFERVWDITKEVIIKHLPIM